MLDNKAFRSFLGGATRQRLLLVAKSGVYQRLMSNFYLVVCTLFAQLA